MSRFAPGLNLVRISADANIGSDDYEVRSVGERVHPSCVLCVSVEIVSQMPDMVIGLNHFVEAVSQFWREIVFEKERHSVSECSNSTASRTEAGLI